LDPRFALLLVLPGGVGFDFEEPWDDLSRPAGGDSSLLETGLGAEVGGTSGWLEGGGDG
jgi:hypothetical protein